jgi:hypothetical protein
VSERKLDLLKGTLDLLVLQVLSLMGPIHGYGIARRLEQISGDALAMNEGTIYASLLRLQHRRLIKTAWVDRAFADEFAAHLDLLTARNEARGLTPDEARRQAILQMGGLNATTDLHRDARGLPRVDRFFDAVHGFGRDLVHAARSLAKARGFTFVCVASLSLGMAAVIAIPYGARILFAPPRSYPHPPGVAP